MAKRIRVFPGRRPGVSALLVAGLMGICVPPATLRAQTPAPAGPGVAAPTIPAPTIPAPGAPAQNIPAASVPAPAVPAPEAARPEEAPKPSEAPKPATDGAGGEMHEYQARQVLQIKGQTPWDDGFVALKTAVSRLENEAKRLNLPRLGNPMVHFIDSDDTGFTYEAMLPLAAPPPAGTAPGPGFEATVSPSGRSVVFTHEGSYDEIDTAYEALTAWLDDKNLVSTGRFLEEYEFIPEKSDEPSMKLRIVVFLK